MEDKDARLIEMEALDVCYGSFRALKQICVGVPGGAVGLLGPNGAGKSTLIKALLGLVPPDRGTARVLGFDARGKALEIRRRVGYMPEGECHIPGMNGFEYVAFCGRLTGMPFKDARRRAHEVLEYVGLGEARYRPVDGYSMGMKQRVKLAQALVHDPRFLILDEPTNGFDPKGREEVLALIYDISHLKDMHLLLSSHLLHDVERTCDSVLLLKDGELVRYGRIRDLRSGEGKAFIVAFKGDREAFLLAVEEKGWRLEAGVKNSVKLLLPVQVSPREVLETALAAKIQIRSLVPAEETLEDLFMRSMGG